VERLGEKKKKNKKMKKCGALWIIALCNCAVVVLGSACYSLSANYTAETGFFNYFNFETFDDPTHGYVDYVDQNEAKMLGLTSYVDGKVYIGADFNSVVPDGARGRKSIRLSSKRTINGNNLVLIDLERMPTTLGSTGVPRGCSVWPAFWTVGQDWPNNGEIDIIEYVNADSIVQTTLHTNQGCDQTSEDASSFTGAWGLSYTGQPSDNCDVNAADQYTNAGCGIIGSPSTVGSSFNDNGVKGGIFAMEWTIDKEIRIFYFSRNNIPNDITIGKPVPDNWGKPYARFEIRPDNCPSSHFQNHQLVFDTTFCGDWAGATYSAVCGSAISCTDLVRNYPKEFVESYWLLNSVQIFDQC
jgi:hypothetical protein